MVDTGDLKSPALCVWVRLPPLVPFRNYMLKDTEILRTSCPEFIYNKLDLAASIEQAIKDVPTVNNTENYITTIGRYDLTTFDGIKLLIAWIEEYLLSIKNDFDKPKAKNIKFGLSWITKLYKGSQVYCHRHHHELDGVAVFYFKTPTKGSELVLVDNAIDNKPVKEQVQENCNFFNIKTGELIVHHNMAKHGVREYTSDTDTIALVFDFNYI